MMKYTLAFVPSLAFLCLLSCQRETPAVDLPWEEASGAEVSFTVEDPGGDDGDSVTKGSYNTNESTVNRWTLTIFDSSGNHVFAERVSGNTAITRHLPEGSYTAYALVNGSTTDQYAYLPQYSGGGSQNSSRTGTIYNTSGTSTGTLTVGGADLSAGHPTLQGVQDALVHTYNNRNYIAMGGSVTFSVTATQAKNGTAISKPITVRRCAAKVQLNQVSLDFSNYAEKRLVERSLTIKNIYVTNVPTFSCWSNPDRDYRCLGWFNNRKYVYNQYAVHLADLDVDASPRHDSPYVNTHVFYVSPNPSTTDTYSGNSTDRYMRLVLECEIQGPTSDASDKETFYYPIPLGTVLPNHTYVITNLTLHKLGSTSQERAVDGSASYTITSSIQDWSSTYSVTVTRSL